MKYSAIGVLNEIMRKSDSIAVIEDGFLFVTSKKSWDDPEFDDEDRYNDDWEKYCSEWEYEVHEIVKGCGITSIPTGNDEWLQWKLPSNIGKIMPDCYKD